jgi:3-carboxy-cis,cis-muconate cycloisomerase
LLTHALGTTDALTRVFSDASIIRAMLDVEVALARVQGRLGIIPADAADGIVRAARAGDLDVAVLVNEVRKSGALAIPLVAAFTSHVRGMDDHAARFVHWGATSQDIVDTALVLLLRRAVEIMANDHRQLCATLRALSDRHAGTVMLGRTLLQPAPPITFGLKVAGWLGAVSRSWGRVSGRVRDASVIQFGGASGTLASLDDRGLAVAEALASELQLQCPDAPWHTHRDRLVAVVAAFAIYTGSLGKMARDISLLMQSEIAEAAEPGGGSSTMPQKRNPVGCAIALAAAARLPGLAATMLTGMVQEHERSAGAWHAEWPTIADAIQATGAALAAMRDVTGGLTVDADRMRANIEATHGTIFAEHVMMRLAATLGRDRAHALVRDVLARAKGTGQTFGDALRSTPEIVTVLSEDELRTFDRHEDYLGSAEALRQRLLGCADDAERSSADFRLQATDSSRPQATDPGLQTIEDSGPEE